MQDHNTAAKLLLVEQIGRLTDTKRVNLDRLVIEESVKAETTDIQGAADRVKCVLDTMTTVFAPKDSLLSSQGLVTIYYWLVRDALRNPAVDITRIRPFLVKFTGELQLNKRRNSDDPLLDPELRGYEVLARSINDARSLTSCYSILRRRLYRELGLETAEQQRQSVLTS